MTAKIRILEEAVANTIAAGEVVENPASMIKELVENSLDANATMIKIIIKNSGRYVKIIDNGTGMVLEDIYLCVERHATSKISVRDDIFKLSTYGFRGEALASIASVAKMTVESRYKDNETGNLVSIQGGEIKKSIETGRNVGTEIEVKNLFYNTPARLKFLKTKTTEYGKVKDIVLKEALANYNVSFTLVIEDRLSLKTSGKGLKNTVLEIFGKNILKNMKEFDYGYIGNTDILRSNSNSIYTYFNGRYAKSRIVEKAVIDAYYTKLPKGRYPYAIVLFEIDPKEIDVNIHPSKKVVKFSDDKAVYKKVKDSVMRSLLKNEIKLTPKIEIKTLEKIDQNIYELESQNLFEVEEESKAYNEANVGFNNYNKSEENKIDKPRDNDFNISKKREDILIEKREQRIIGQLDNMYILVETKKSLEIYDQHVVHERILYEEFKEKYYSKKMNMRQLLIPLTFNIDLNDKTVIFENIELFNDFGFEIEDFGEKEIIIRKVPDFDFREEIKDLILDIVSDLYEKSEINDIREKIIISMSCKAAIKAGENISFEEMDILLKKLHSLGKYTCPHGRPIIVNIDYLELLKKFGRR